MTPTPVVEVNDLSLEYGGVRAVSKLSLQVNRGEFYALLGTNGAGKTSTLETVEGHRTPTSGTVRVFGENPTDRRRVRPRMGIMLQEGGFSADLTARETVRLVGRLSGRKDDVDQVLATVDMTHKATARVGSLSGGEKRRLDFATAVYGAPELIFLDEPTTGLDIQSRDMVWDAVGRLRERGSTIVLTTHYLEEAQQNADRIGLMHRGALHREGTVAELTRSLPSTIRFTLAAGVPSAPLGAQVTIEGVHTVQTFELQRDLHQLLDWARDHGVELRDLEAAPHRLDDVFRSIGND